MENENTLAVLVFIVHAFVIGKLCGQERAGQTGRRNMACQEEGRADRREGSRLVAEAMSTSARAVGEGNVIECIEAAM